MWKKLVLPLVLAAPFAVRAQNTDPAEGGLRCVAREGGVLLEWNFAFFVPIEAWVIQRDGRDLARLEPNAASYFDAEAGAGAHAYGLFAINWTGELLSLAKCEVVVEDFGLRCKAEENKVALEWGPILIDVLILRFRISRNGETIATVPPDQLSFSDEVYSVGSYTYAVHAVTSPESEFLVGRCTVRVSCFGLRATVKDLQVHLEWDPSPIVPPIAPTYVVTRDDELVAKTLEPEVTDTVPAPGAYLYQVWEDFGIGLGIPVRIVGSCLVRVPGPIPGPRNLVCAIELVPIEPIPVDPSPVEPADEAGVDLDGDGTVDAVIPRVVVALSWENPINAYDKIVIVRNNATIATLEGSAEAFRDRVRLGGTFRYAVYGVLGDARSEAAECVVDVPPPVVPPPQDLACRVLQSIPVDPVDPTDPAGDASDVIPVPVTVVAMSWWNPVSYARIVVTRNKAIVATLPGDAMGYRDVDPPAGVHVYGVHGVLADGRRSPAAECTVEIGVRPVPPVRDLECTVEQPSAADARAAVILVWSHPIRYDRIVVLRDGDIIFEDSGELEKYRDLPAPAGVHTYCVVGVLDERRSPPTCCQVVVEGPPQRNLLYFTRGVLDPAEVDLSVEPPLPDPLPVLPGNRIVCLANNPAPLQGWSFGVGSDPRYIVPTDANIRGTATRALNGGAGPDFLHIAIAEGGSGVSMAVVIDTDGTSAASPTLPPGRGHRLLNIVYEAGPEGAPGEPYPVRYTSSLGDPPVQVLFVVGGFEVTPGTLPGWVSLPGPEFLRADSNGDGTADISDAKHMLDYLFLGGDEPGCLEAANANGSTQLNVADPIYLLQYLFNGGPEPPFPWPNCAYAPAPLGCRDPGECSIAAP